MGSLGTIEKLSRIGVVLKPTHPRAREVAEAAIALARRRGLKVLLDREAADFLGRPADGMPREEVCKASELVIVLGGDGTMLGVARAAKEAGTPLLGVNLGELGYLTTTVDEELGSFLDQVLAGQAIVEERLMLRAQILRGGLTVETHDVLNDVVVTKAALARILDIDVRIDGTYVSTYRADGLILSTPTGSTAYTLAAQGPILHPRIEAIVITPICPHTLSLRPLVVPSACDFEIRILTERAEVHLSLDGQIGVPLLPGDLVRARKSPFVTRLLLDPRRDSYTTLREKLRWGSFPKPGRRSDPG